MGKAASIIANVAVAVAATAIFGPQGGFLIGATRIGMAASLALAAVGAAALSGLPYTLEPKPQPGEADR